jgi:hypothetical protein
MNWGYGGERCWIVSVVALLRDDTWLVCEDGRDGAVEFISSTETLGLFL